MTCSSWASGLFQLEPQDSFARKFFDEIEAKLPQKMQRAFPNGIQVIFGDIEGHGKTRKNGRIILNKKLQSVIRNGEAGAQPTPERTHKTDYIETQATVVHETSHLYDLLNQPDENIRSWTSWCQSIPKEPNTSLPDGCEAFLGTKTTLSTNPFYLEIAGWFLTPEGVAQRRSENYFGNRTPDPYEFKNPYEHLAVNMEYYLLDPEYHCRRPLLNDFFERHFGEISKIKSKKCQPNTKYLDPRNNNADNFIKEIPLERVYQVHLLHADQGTAFMSRFGHSMFRLIICKPGRELGPDCMKDEAFHLVLSFRAFVNTPAIDSMAGLTGKYPSRLFFIPFYNVKEEYNETELRDLKSLPLKLNREEIKRFVLKAIETHWTYDGKYYFISNNCAVESLNLLRAALLKYEVIDKKIIYPNDLLDVLVKTGIAENVNYKNRIQAINQGYLFENYGERNARSLSLLLKTSVHKEQARSFVRQNFQERQKSYTQAQSREEITAVISLENSAVVVHQSSMTQRIADWVVSSGNAMDILDLHKKSADLFNVFSAPFQALKSAEYGIPSDEELTKATEELKIKKKALIEINQKKENLKDGLKLDDEIRELESTTSGITAWIQILLTAHPKP